MLTPPGRPSTLGLSPSHDSPRSTNTVTAVRWVLSGRLACRTTAAEFGLGGPLHPALPCPPSGPHPSAKAGDGNRALVRLSKRAAAAAQPDSRVYFPRNELFIGIALCIHNFPA